MAKKRKTAGSKQRGGGDLEVVRAALDLAGIPNQDAFGRALETVGSRVIFALGRMSGGFSGGFGNSNMDPHNPQAIMDAWKRDQMQREAAMHPVAPEPGSTNRAGKVAKVGRKAKVARKPAKAPKPAKPAKAARKTKRRK